MVSDTNQLKMQSSRGKLMDELYKGEILIYQSESGDTKIDVYLEDGTVWLLQALIADLYQTTKQNIIMHTRNIYKNGSFTKRQLIKNPY